VAYDLEAAITTLGKHGWPAIILREPHRSAAENDALIQLALDVGIKSVICHEKSAHTIPTGKTHVGEGWLGSPNTEKVGVSCHNAAQVQSALGAGANYTLLSPLFTPTSKPNDSRTPLGLPNFLAIAKDRPVLALGGINPDNYAQILAAGVYGVAIMGSIFNNPKSVEMFLQIYWNQKIKSSSS